MKNKFNPWDPGPELLDPNVNPRMQGNSIRNEAPINSILRVMRLRDKRGSAARPLSRK